MLYSNGGRISVGVDLSAPLLYATKFTRCLGAFFVFLAARSSWHSAAAVTTEVGAPPPPIAPVIPTRFETFGAVRVDNYDWLRDRKDSRVIDYLEAENAYANAVSSRLDHS
jgi:hypothetical protein